MASRRTVDSIGVDGCAADLTKEPAYPLRDIVALGELLDLRSILVKTKYSVGYPYNVFEIGSRISDVHRHTVASRAIVHIIVEVAQTQVIWLG